MLPPVTGMAGETPSLGEVMFDMSPLDAGLVMFFEFEKLFKYSIMPGVEKLPGLKMLDGVNEPGSATGTDVLWKPASWSCF